MRALPFLLTFAVPASVVAGFWLGGWWTFLTVVQNYGVLPLLDHLVGPDETDVPALREGEIGNAFTFRAIVVAAVPVQVALIIWAGFKVTSGNLNAIEIAGLTVSVGRASGIAITAAHELLHQRKFERLLSRILMGAVTYTHFCLEHLHGHHVLVGTPADPASARLGESLYRFVLRVVLSGVRESWRREAARMRRRRQAAYGPNNRMVRYAFFVLVIYAAAAAVWGWGGVTFLAAQSAIGIFMLETINYLEHYGLYRRETAPGVYEPVAARHSWDSGYRLSNWSVFNLGRHADHHLHVGRRYPILRRPAEAARLPTGYAGIFLLALAPPLWRRVMDPRALAAAPRSA